MMKKQFPTLHSVCIPPSGGVSFSIVMSMQQRYAGEARHAILAAMSTNLRPKIVTVVDPDINVQSSAEVEWAVAFRMQPQRDVIVVDGLPAGPLDPSVERVGVRWISRTASAIGIDATRAVRRRIPKGCRRAGLARLRRCRNSARPHSPKRSSCTLIAPLFLARSAASATALRRRAVRAAARFAQALGADQRRRDSERHLGQRVLCRGERLLQEGRHRGHASARSPAARRSRRRLSAVRPTSATRT